MRSRTRLTAPATPTRRRRRVTCDTRVARGAVGWPTVMATGIVSVDLERCGATVLSVAALAVTAGVWLVLLGGGEPLRGPSSQVGSHIKAPRSGQRRRTRPPRRRVGTVDPSQRSAAACERRAAGAALHLNRAMWSGPRRPTVRAWMPPQAPPQAAVSRPPAGSARDGSP